MMFVFVCFCVFVRVVKASASLKITFVDFAFFNTKCPSICSRFGLMFSWGQQKARQKWFGAEKEKHRKLRRPSTGSPVWPRAIWTGLWELTTFVKQKGSPKD